MGIVENLVFYVKTLPRSREYCGLVISKGASLKTTLINVPTLTFFKFPLDYGW